MNIRENFLKIASLVSPFFLNITTIIYTPPQNKIKSKFQIKIQTELIQTQTKLNLNLELEFSLHIFYYTSLIISMSF